MAPLVPEIIVFKDANFNGEARFIADSVANIGSHWNDSITSLIVVKGNWQLFQHENYGGLRSQIIGPGNYNNVEFPEVNISNDSITSIKLISSE